MTTLYTLINKNQTRKTITRLTSINMITAALSEPTIEEIATAIDTINAPDVILFTIFESIPRLCPSTAFLLSFEEFTCFCIRSSARRLPSSLFPSNKFFRIAIN